MAWSDVMLRVQPGKLISVRVPKTVPTERVQRTIKLTVAPDDATPPEYCAGEGSPASPEQAILPQFGENFSTIECLTEDSLGALYRVRNEGMQKDFSVRLVRNEQLPDEEARKAFLRFCRRYSTVTHPALLPMYSFAENELGVWFVSDYCTDPTLEDLIDTGELKSEGKILDVYEHLLETIEGMHTVGIKFSATKPGSVYVQESAQGHMVRLRDWWAMGLQNSRQTALDAESMSYASPELIEDNGKVDARSDIFSFGASLYEALTGRVPHREADGLKLAIRIMSSDVPPVDGPFANSNLAKIAMRCLNKNPEQRYQTFADLRADFKAVARGNQISQPKQPVAASQQAARKWLAFWCAFVVSLCMFSAIISSDELPDEPLSPTTAATDAELTGDLASAEDYLAAAVADTPSDSKSWYNLGRIRLLREEYSLAQEALNEAIKLDPNYAEAFDKLGELKTTLGDVDGATAAYQRAAAINAHDPTSHGQLSVAYWRQNKLDEAIREGQEAVRLGPDDSFAHYTLAFAYDEAGKYAEAAKEYRATLDIDPEYGDVLSNLSLVYSKLNEHESAVATALKATRLDPASSEYWANLGHAYLRKGDLAEAEINLKKSLAIEPFKYKAMANLAEVMKKQGKRAEAKKLMKQVIE